VATASYYQTVAANLDRIACDVRSCDQDTVSPCRVRLPALLQGAATSAVLDQFDTATMELTAAAALLERAAAAARRRAAELEAAEALAAAAVAEPAEPPPPDPAALPFF